MIIEVSLKTEILAFFFVTDVKNEWAHGHSSRYRAGIFEIIFFGPWTHALFVAYDSSAIFEKDCTFSVELFDGAWPKGAQMTWFIFSMPYWVE